MTDTSAARLAFRSLITEVLRDRKDQAPQERLAWLQLFARQTERKYFPDECKTCLDFWIQRDPDGTPHAYLIWDGAIWRNVTREHFETVHFVFGGPIYEGKD
jgi:hypothetical protein